LILLPVPKATLVNLEHTFTALGNCCKIAISPIDLQEGETKAQACENGLFATVNLGLSPLVRNDTDKYTGTVCALCVSCGEDLEA
jgi:hypothetical protein